MHLGSGATGKHPGGAWEPPAWPNPCQVDARSSFHQGHNNLGGVSSRKHSLSSLQDASFKAQRLARNCPTTIGAVPASKSNKSLPERPLSGHFALKERAGKLSRRKCPTLPPSPQLDLVPAWACEHEMSQLRAEIVTLQEAVRQLAGQSFSKNKANNTNNNNNNNNDIEPTTTTTTPTTTTTMTTTTTITTTHN